MGQRPDWYGRCDDPYYGAGISGKIYRGKTERAKVYHAVQCYALYWLYCFKYCLIQRYHTCGNALDLRILSWCITFPFLHLWGTDRRSKKRTVSEETLAMGHPFWAVCAAYASGRTVLPQLLSKAVSVAGPAAL